MLEEEIKYPKVTVGAIIVNRNGKILLVRGERFNRQFYIPGGHIEWGETMADALQREIKEETGLAIYDIKFLRPVEFIFSKDYDGTRHIVPIDYVAKTDKAEDAVRLDGRESAEYAWFTEEEIIKNNDIESTTKESIILYFQNQKKERQCSEYKANWQRALADYQNLLKETAKRRQEWVEMSELEVLEEFLPVYDHFKLAFRLQTSDFSPDEQKWADGIKHIMKEFGDVLKAHKIEEIKTVGEKFDPNIHESAGEEQVEGKKHGEIVREVDGGYKMNGRVIKPARVIIAK